MTVRKLFKMGNRIKNATKERSLPVVLMVEKNMAAERKALAEWLESSRFLSCDAVDVFEAIEELADFTVRDRPEVIVLDTDPCSENLNLVRSMLRSGKCELSILTLSTTSHQVAGDCFQGDLTAVRAHLDTLIPERSNTH
jgi:hypothetical protein